MAMTVQITDRGKTAKIRSPWALPLFAIITLGIYYLVWYYKVNREMSDWGEQHKVDLGTSPGMSVIAITLGGILIIPPFVSIWGTGKRMQLSQRVADVHGGSGLLWFVLHIIPIVSLFAPTYLQSELNKVWETREEPMIGPGGAVGQLAPQPAPSYSPTERVGDSDLERTIELLRQHMLAGRLSSAEFETRVGEVHNATTRGDLEGALVDLPSSPPALPTGD
jgi:uncharacterized protein DUF1707/uncharacterized protein DUF4234